jgi:hypothetical protein
VNPTEIAEHEIERNRVNVVVELLRESVGQAGEPAHRRYSKRAGQQQGNTHRCLFSDIGVSELPIETLLSFYIELQAPAGSYNIEIRLSGPQEKAEAILKARFESNNANANGTIASPRVGVTMIEVGIFCLDARISEGRWTNLLSKRVSVDPNALQQPS